MHPRELSIEWITFFVAVQTVAVAILAVGTMVLLRWRVFRTKRLSAYKAEYGAIIAEAVALGHSRLDIERPQRRHFIRCFALRETLLENIASIVGPERLMLVEEYMFLGCADHDRWECSSWRWWVRLQALANLSTLRRKEFATLFETLRLDKNQLVAAAALIGLSQLEDRRNNPGTILPRLPLSFLKNINLLLELTQNWTALYGYEWIAQYLKKYPETKVARALTGVLIALRTEESSTILLDVLALGLLKDARIVMRIKASVISMGDQAAVERLFEIESNEILLPIEITAEAV